MVIREYLASVVCVALLSGVAATVSMRGIAQAQEPRPDLSGRWQLNAELSENGQAKLERMHASRGGGHGPSGHLGGMFGGAPSAAQMEEARALLVYVPAWFTLKHDGERIVLTDSGGRVRTLTPSGRKETVNGRETRTKWDQHRLVSEISLGRVKVIEIYERLTNSPQLAVTTTMDIGGQAVYVRRVYDPESSR